MNPHKTYFQNDCNSQINFEGVCFLKKNMSVNFALLYNRCRFGTNFPHFPGQVNDLLDQVNDSLAQVNFYLSQRMILLSQRTIHLSKSAIHLSQRTPDLSQKIAVFGSAKHLIHLNYITLYILVKQF
jgi:hypothetical protein